MRLKSKSQLQVMRKSSSLPEAVGTKGGNIVFRVYVEVDAALAVKNNVLSLSYEISPVNVEKIITPNFSDADSRQIYQIAALKVEKLKRDKDLIVYSGIVDVTKYIPNDKLRFLQAGSPVKTSTIFRVSSSRNSIKLPALRSGSVSKISPSAAIAKKTYKTIADYKMKDPAQDLNARPSHAPISKILAGLRTTGNYQDYDLQFEAARLEMQKSGDAALSIERSEQEVKFVIVPLDIEIPESNVRKYKLSIRALKNKISVQNIIQDVDFQILLKDATVPSIAPKISIVDNGTKRKIGIKQLDPRASEIRIYRKLMNKDSSIEDSYELVTSLNAASGDAFNLTDANSSMQRGIYRAVSYDAGGKTIGEFTSAVIGKSKISKQKNVEDPLTIFACETVNGIQIFLYNIPYGVVAVRAVRRNLTIYEKEFSTPISIDGNGQKSIDNETNNTSFLDRPVRPDTIYEYKVIMTDVRGNTYESQRSSIVHFIGSKSAEESKSLISQDYKIESDGVERTVSFQIDVSSSKTTLDQVYDILSSTGLESQYLDEIKSNRELLNKITALEIVRFDCSTGYIENFGVVKAGVFEDSPRSRKVYNVSNVLPGNKYIYYARLLVRSPGTIFSQVNVSRIDVETGKSFTTNLKKYNSPKTLKKGVLASNVIQKRAISVTGLSNDPSSSTSDEMIAGMTSTTVIVTVDIPRRDVDVRDIFLRKTQRGNEITWSLFANDRKIDHVIIHADYNGRMAPLRAIHFDGSSKMMFLDEMLANEKNQVNYYIQVVYANYDMGSIIGPARNR